MSQPTTFSGVEGRSAELTVFFGRDLNVGEAGPTVVGPASKSQPLTISDQSARLCPPFAPMTDDVAGQQPFSASLSYVNADEI